MIVRNSDSLLIISTGVSTVLIPILLINNGFSGLQSYGLIGGEE